MGLLTSPCFGSYANKMDVTLSHDQESFVRRAIEAGRYVRKEDAIQDALSLWEERERCRAELLASLDAADSALLREGRIITQESMRVLASEVKQRGRDRLVAERQA